MALQIDIKTKYYHPDDYVYRLFPGDGYWLYETMRDRSVVFLDNPGIGIPGPRGYSKDQLFLENLVRAELARKVIRANRSNLSSVLSEIEGSDLGRLRWTRNHELSLSWLNRLNHTANIGDVVIVPCPRHAKDADGNPIKPKTLIGEITGNPQVLSHRVPPNIVAGQYVARSVRWLAQIDERDLTNKLIASLRTQNALIGIRAEFSYRALSIAYNNLLIGDEHYVRFTTNKVGFSAYECFHFTAFVMAVVAAHKIFMEDRGTFHHNQSIYEIAAQFDELGDFVPEQEASIHSPGYTTLRGRHIVPAVVAALFSLALESDANPLSDSELYDVNVVNTSSDTPDPCELEIEESVRETLSIMGFDRWKEMCRAARIANNNEGLRSVTSVREDKNGEG